MNCLTCGHKNPMTGGYCQKCGGKLDMTADEIRESLVERARGEAVQSAAGQAKHAVTFAVVLLGIALTAFVLSGGAPEGSPQIPASSLKAKYLEPEIKTEISLPKLSIPLEPKKRK